MFWAAVVSLCVWRSAAVNKVEGGETFVADHSYNPELTRGVRVGFDALHEVVDVGSTSPKLDSNASEAKHFRWGDVSRWLRFGDDQAPSAEAKAIRVI